MSDVRAKLFMKGVEGPLLADEHYILLVIKKHPQTAGPGDVEVFTDQTDPKLIRGVLSKVAELCTDDVPMSDWVGERGNPRRVT